MTPDAVDIEPLDVPREGIPDVTHDAGQTLAEFTDFIEQVEPDDFRN